MFRGMVFTCTPGSVLTIRAFLPFFMVIFNVVKKEVWPSVAVSVKQVPSLERVNVMLSDQRGWAGMIFMLFWL